MKIKKLVIILISIIVPLVITTLVCLYSYGFIGDWKKNQENFIDHIFDEAKTSEEKIDLYVKFNSGSYDKLYDNIELFKDYQISNETIKPDANGVFNLEHFKMSSYVLLGDETNNKFSYNFYFHNVDNTEVNLTNAAFVVFQTNDINDTNLLDELITNYTNNLKEGEADERFVKNLSYASKNMFFTTGELLEDVNGVAKIVNGVAANRLLYFYNPTVFYNRSGNFAGSESAQFALIETIYDGEDVKDVKVLTTGKINNIGEDEESYAKEHPNMSKGYTLDTFKSVRNAGYFAFVWKTVLLHTIIALIISGVLGFMFYKTWSFEQVLVEEPKNKYKFKKKK